jgi:predicted Zn-dependent protease
VFVDKYPKDPLLRYHYARSLYHKGEVQAAIAQLEETMKLDPDMPEVHYMLGGIYLRMGDEKKAHEALNNFTRLTGKSGK